MPEPPPLPASVPDPAQTALLAALLSDQRRRWQDGERPPAEQYLSRHPALAAHADASLELIYQEVYLREQRGEVAGVEEYVARFPQWETDLRRLFEVHDALQPREHGEVDAGLLPPPSADLPAYADLEEIGRGTMGVVYRAFDRRHARPVAIKVLRPEHFADRSARKRFLREARAAVRLNHPNIVRVYEAGDSPLGPYLAMELIEGPTLEATLRHGPLSVEAAVAALLPAVHAVDFAHGRGVIHRDLKPGNILLHPERGPVVLDFGMAKVLGVAPGGRLSTSTRPGTILGTPAYMPPEQTGGDQPPIGPRSDVYALGAILYALLTGRPPFAEATALDTICKVRSPEPPPPIRLRRPDVPAELEAICLRCLEKPPERRYATARELAEALRPWEPRGGPPSAAPADAAAAAGPVLIEEATGRRLPLAIGDTILGRGTQCNLILGSPKVSRRHCRLTRDADGTAVQDLGSRWGTRVNGRPVDRSILRDGDRIEIGDHAFVYRQG